MLMFFKSDKEVAVLHKRDTVQYMLKLKMHENETNSTFI